MCSPSDVAQRRTAGGRRGWDPACRQRWTSPGDRCIDRAGRPARAVPDPERRGPVPRLLPHRHRRSRAPTSTTHRRGRSSPRRASAPGFPSVCAVPLRLKDLILGCLNLFMSEPVALSDAEISLAQALADVASIAIVQDHGNPRGRDSRGSSAARPQQPHRRSSRPRA